MKVPGLIAIAFLAGLGVGWFGKIWVEAYQLTFSTFITNATSGNQSTAGVADSISDAVSIDSGLATQSELAQSSQAGPATQNTLNNDPQLERQGLVEGVTSKSVLDTFEKLLKEQRYFNAMTLFQEQKTQSEQIAAQLKVSLLDELKYLIEVRNNSDFS